MRTRTSADDAIGTERTAVIRDQTREEFASSTTADDIEEEERAALIRTYPVRGGTTISPE